MKNQPPVHLNIAANTSLSALQQRLGLEGELESISRPLSRYNLTTEIPPAMYNLQHIGENSLCRTSVPGLTLKTVGTICPCSNPLFTTDADRYQLPRDSEARHAGTSKEAVGVGLIFVDILSTGDDR